MKLRNFKAIKNFKNKKILVRVDFNCPIRNGRVVDDSRIRAALPTIKYLVGRGAKIILISHLGKPKGERLGEYSLRPVYKNLKLNLRPELRSREIKNLKFVDDCIGEKVERAISAMKPSDVILLENLRFYKGEEDNDAQFAKNLASLADVYINDAFGCSHRAHASVVAVTEYLPSYAGFLLAAEIKNLSQVLDKPKYPFAMVMGGVKISTKIPVIKNLIKKADYILVGGALAHNFLKMMGYKIGKSIYETEIDGEVKKIIRQPADQKIILPADFRIKEIRQSRRQTDPPSGGPADKNVKIEDLNKLKDDFEILDIGPKTIELFSKYLKNAKMIVWNGPMGYFEVKPFDLGTRKIAEVILSNKKAKIIIGGGETIASLKIKNQRSKIKIRKNIFISTGGGAMLEFLGGDQLPGIKPLIK